jgi:outer membrane protein TolC
MSRTALALAALLGLAMLRPLAAQPAVAPGDTLALSLSDALTRALSTSEEIGLAESQIDLADAQVREAYSSLYPQIDASAGYTRTLQSSFDTGGGAAVPDSLMFNPDPTLPLEDRVEYLEQNAPNAALGALGGLFSDLPFGQENTYSFALSGSQVLFAPQAGAGIQIARHFRDAARYNFTEEQADVRLQVEEAYIQALLAGELVTISNVALEQAQAFLDEEELRLRAGRASELEVLRAEVELENLRPQLVQAQNALEVSVLNLKRLANIPYDQPLALTTPLTLPPADALADPALDPEAITSARASVLAAQEQVEIREAQVRLERAAYLPRVAASASYARQLFADGIFDFGGEWRPDFTVGVGIQIPIFNGFQRSARVQQARVQLSQAEYQLSQLREAVQLQLEQARGEKERARSLIAARQRTVDQAERVYNLTTLQYDEGVTTQLDVSNARLALLQARSNLVQALADFYLADSNLVRAQVAPGLGNAQPTLPENATPAPVEPPAPEPSDITPADDLGDQ